MLDLYSFYVTDYEPNEYLYGFWLLEQNQLKQNDVCWKDGVYYLRNEKQQLVEKSRIDVSNYQKEHNIKDQDIKILF